MTIGNWINIFNTSHLDWYQACLISSILCKLFLPPNFPPQTSFPVFYKHRKYSDQKSREKGRKAESNYQPLSGKRLLWHSPWFSFKLSVLISSMLSSFLGPSWVQKKSLHCQAGRERGHIILKSPLKRAEEGQDSLTSVLPELIRIKHFQNNFLSILYFLPYT